METIDQSLDPLIKGELQSKPWQLSVYDRTNATWQAAAMRKRSHFRRTNASLGVACVDPSGRLEPSQMPGHAVNKVSAPYFLALSVRPDHTKEKFDAACQTKVSQHTVISQPAEAEKDDLAATAGQQTDRATTASVPAADPDISIPARTPHRDERPPLIYCTLLNTKAEAPDAVKNSLRRCRRRMPDFLMKSSSESIRFKALSS